MKPDETHDAPPILDYARTRRQSNIITGEKTLVIAAAIQTAFLFSFSACFFIPDRWRPWLWMTTTITAVPTLVVATVTLTMISRRRRGGPVLEWYASATALISGLLSLALIVMTTIFWLVRR
jgi:hypothetical protein